MKKITLEVERKQGLTYLKFNLGTEIEKSLEEKIE